MRETELAFERLATAAIGANTSEDTGDSVVELYERPHDEVIRVLIKALEGPDEHRRAVATAMLGAGSISGAEAAIPALTRILHNDSNDMRRNVAGKTLATIGPDNPAAVAALDQVVRDKSNLSDLRGAVVLGLGLCGTRGALDSLLVTLRDETEDPSVRNSACISLTKMATTSPLVIPELMKLVTHPELGPVVQKIMQKIAEVTQ